MPIVSQAQFSELPDFTQQQLRDILTRAEALGRDKYDFPSASRIADIPQDINIAHRLARDEGKDYRRYLDENERLSNLASRDFPSEAARYMNPYQRQVLDRIAEEGNRNFREKLFPELQSAFIRSGQSGSSGEKEYAARLARNVNSEILGRQAQALASGYQQAAQIYSADMARKLEAAREMGSIGAMRQAGLAGEVSLLGEQGRYIQQQNQAKLDEQFQEYIRQKMFPWEMLERQAAIFHGMPSPATLHSYSERPAAPQTNIAGQAGQLAAAILGARLAGGK